MMEGGEGFHRKKYAEGGGFKKIFPLGIVYLSMNRKTNISGGGDSSPCALPVPHNDGRIVFHVNSHEISQCSE